MGARWLALLHGGTTAIFVVMIAWDTTGMAEFLGMPLASGDGRVEFLAMYVGASGTIAAFCLYAGTTQRYLREAVVLIAVFMSGLAAVRLGGAIWPGSGTTTAGALIYDIPVAVWAVLAWRSIVGRPLATES